MSPMPVREARPEGCARWATEPPSQGDYRGGGGAPALRAPPWAGATSGTSSSARYPPDTASRHRAPIDRALAGAGAAVVDQHGHQKCGLAPAIDPGVIGPALDDDIEGPEIALLLVQHQRD